MASNALALIALLLSFNLLFFTMVSATDVDCHCSTPKTPKHPKSPTSPKTPKSPTSPTPVPKTPKSPVSPPKTPISPPLPPNTPSSPPPAKSTCPIDTLKLGVCGNLLNDLVNIVVGTQTNTPCCTLIQGIADVDAAVCLCTAIKANVLGINLNVPISLELLLNFCGKKVPTGFQCA